MIKGYYKTTPKSPADHQLNYLLGVLEHAVGHGDMAPDEAMEVLGEYYLAACVAVPRLVPELGGIANSAHRPLNGVLRIIFYPDDHEYCTSGWL